MRTRHPDSLRVGSASSYRRCPSDRGAPDGPSRGCGVRGFGGVPCRLAVSCHRSPLRNRYRARLAVSPGENGGIVQLRLIDVAIGLVATFFLIGRRSLRLLVEAGKHDLQEAVQRPRGRHRQDARRSRRRSRCHDLASGHLGVQGDQRRHPTQARTPQRKRCAVPSLTCRPAPSSTPSSRPERSATTCKGSENKLPDSPFRQRIEAMVKEGETDLTKIKAGLEKLVRRHHGPPRRLLQAMVPMAPAHRRPRPRRHPQRVGHPDPRHPVERLHTANGHRQPVRQPDRHPMPDRQEDLHPSREDRDRDQLPRRVQAPSWLG